MSDLKIIEEIIQKIESTKEVLSTMPKNNEKNITKYREKIKELETEYQEQEESILKILKRKYNKVVQVENNKEIEKLTNEINTIKQDLYLLDEYKTSYEKMGLDKDIYKLRKYYKENFENVNQQILNCINKFSSVGINLEASDFNHSIYATEYMEVFIEELKKGNINSEKIKSKFEEVYWKCPDIIIHIDLSFRNLYLNHENEIDKFFLSEKNKLLNSYHMNSKEIMNLFFDLKNQKKMLIMADKKTLLDRFLSGELNTKSYTEEKMENYYSKIFSKEILENIAEKNSEIQMNIFKFLCSLYEYKNYMTFKLMVDDIRNLYKEKEGYKKVFEETKKKINSSEKKLQQLNKKMTSKGLFGQKKENQKQSLEQNQIISDLKNLYKELDIHRFYNAIYLNLTDSSTIYDVLNLANSYYRYLVSFICQTDTEATQEEIDKQIESLDEFVKSPCNIITNNITILEEKDIALIIKDRYALLNFIVEKENLKMDNVDTLISTLEAIYMKFNLEKAGLTIEELDEICEMKKILNEK